MADRFECGRVPAFDSSFPPKWWDPLRRGQPSFYPDIDYKVPEVGVGQFLRSMRPGEILLVLYGSRVEGATGGSVEFKKESGLAVRATIEPSPG